MISPIERLVSLFDRRPKESIVGIVCITEAPGIISLLVILGIQIRGCSWASLWWESDSFKLQNRALFTSADSCRHLAYHLARGPLPLLLQMLMNLSLYMQLRSTCKPLFVFLFWRKALAFLHKNTLHCFLSALVFSGVPISTTDHFCKTDLSSGHWCPEHPFLLRLLLAQAIPKRICLRIEIKSTVLLISTWTAFDGRLGWCFWLYSIAVLITVVFKFGGPLWFRCFDFFLAL